MDGRPEHVDAVVVGSGFGASVAAYRLAQAGRSVVVLERGRAYPPGSFARNPYEMSRAFWEPKDELFGLFDIRSFRKIESIVSAGLGGGSLIYANVLLRKDERWFVHDSPLPGGGYENWPIGRRDLDRHYDAVEAMMTPTPNPYPDLPKSKALREAAETLNLEVISPPLAIAFSGRPGERAEPKQVVEPPAYGNYHDATRLTCRLCGECDIGCNEGAKNTLDHNYLSAARFHGADIRTLADVGGITPLGGGGYEVRYLQYSDGPGEDGKRVRTARRLTCDTLLLGAGTFGTTALLLKNRVGLPALGRAVGSRFSGNGDLLTFCMGARDTTSGGRMRLIDGSYGPVITTSIRRPDGVDEEGAGRGYYVQEAGFPGFANWLIETAQVGSQLQRAASMARDLIAYRLKRRNESTISAEVAKLIGEGRLTSSSIPLLGMGRDTPDGRIMLTDGELDVEWCTTTSTAYFESMRATMRSISDTLAADFKDNPLWWTKRVVTVHPLGGAPMGRHIHEGVVDSWGESFGHPGLFVVDGAAVPGPVGPNPSLTIAAMADRAVEHLLERPRPSRRAQPVEATGMAESHSTVTPDPASVAPDPTSVAPDPATVTPDPTSVAPDPATVTPDPASVTPDPTSVTPGPASVATASTSVTPDLIRGLSDAMTEPVEASSGDTSFTEQMKGFITLGETDPLRGWTVGRQLFQRFMFELTITAPDVERFVASEAREGTAEGYVECDLLGGRLPVQRGWFNLFVATDDAAAREMRYRLWFSDLSGTPITMYGFKDVRDDPGLDLWRDTSTLYITLLRGHVPPGEQGEVIGAGILRILPRDFARQLTTFRGSGTGPLKAIAGFSAFFLKSLHDVYLKPAPSSVIPGLTRDLGSGGGETPDRVRGDMGVGESS